MSPPMPSLAPLPPALDFFAGSGLVSVGLAREFSVVWANDFCPKKAAIYTANHGAAGFDPRPIQSVSGRDLPPAALSWGSFPCQDLSLAGAMAGLSARRSGLVWEWLRVMDEMAERPPVVAAENVLGLVSADGGRHCLDLHDALAERGYRVGAAMLDAIHWLPQSRPRVFVVGAREDVRLDGLTSAGPGWAHPEAVARVARSRRDWVWWNLPKPRGRRPNLLDLVEFDAPRDPPDKRDRNLALIPPRHAERLRSSPPSDRAVFPGYKRIRAGRQVLELRFDGVAGCLRTPEGGSSRQLLVVSEDGRSDTRLLTIREAARLMGAPRGYRLPGSYNDGYRAMGDAVAVPVVEYLARRLLRPLADRARSAGEDERGVPSSATFGVEKPGKAVA